MNTIYIDANKANSNSALKNEWVHQLNSPLLLPRGTQVQIQTSFINLKGVTGGSIEIKEDIKEDFAYFFYITEQGHPAPMATDPTGDKTWFRNTLNISANSFNNNFAQGNPTIGTNINFEAVQCLYGNGGSDATARASHFDYFRDTGGSNMVLPCVDVSQNSTTGDYVVTPKVMTRTLFVPKGIYGIGQLGQLIEDQINGVRVYDGTAVLEKGMNQLNIESGVYDGNPASFDDPQKSAPCFTRVTCQMRGFDVMAGTAANALKVGGRFQMFVNMFSFNTLMWYAKSIVGDATTHANRNDFLDLIFDAFKQHHAMYSFMTNYDDGVVSGAADPQRDLLGYNLYGGSITNPNPSPQRTIGTSNFQFEYDTEKNGFVLKGLHNQMRSASHDRLGNKMSSAGQPVVNFKQTSMNLFNEADTGIAGVVIGDVAKKSMFNLVSNPETRDGGIMIHNFAYSTAQRLGSPAKIAALKNKEAAQFPDFFDSEADAVTAWSTTLWSRLGFTYDQIGNPSKFGRQHIYTSPLLLGQNYGFTTDTPIDNTIQPTISTMSNPMEWKHHGASTSSGFQMYNLMNTAVPNAMTSALNYAGKNIYANSMYRGVAMFPVMVEDVGGVVAQQLPTLSEDGYFLITSDLVTDYKDNVKKGDPFPLLGVVPKSSLSNQDFIVADNQIVQVLTSGKVVNSVKMTVLNPDLTAPDLDPLSSVILKITVPSMTPMPLLPPKVQQQIDTE